jgi:hypothetical protein
MRGFLKFDLSSIPANAVILNAALDLYADNPTTTFSGNPTTPMNGTNNACTVRRITQPWNNMTITWNNQPSDTNANQVVLPTSVSAGQDYIGTDVRQLVQDMVLYGNYGFKIQPVATQPSNSMIFRTGYYTDSTYRPKLTVVYTIDSMTADLGPDRTSCTGSTAILNAANNGGFPPFTYAWQATGDPLSCANCKNPSVVLTQNSTFICTITDAHNTIAVDTINFTISGGVNQMQASFSNSNISCSNSVDTTVATVVNGIAPITFQWGDGFSSIGGDGEIHNYLQSGIYIINISDSTGCSISVFDTITNSSVNVTLTQAVQPACAGDTTGSIIIAANGGTSPYHYHWVTGNNTPTLLDAAAGAYSVTVTDNNGCSTIFYHNLAPVSDVWAYYVYADGTNANCGNNGTVTAVASEGVPPYTFLWNNGATTPNLTGLSGGTYVVTVTDSTGCTRHANAHVETICVSFITGSVFVDVNSNCVVDTGETPITSLGVRAQKGSHYYYGYTHANGGYTIQVPDTGLYHIAVSTSNYICANMTFCGDTSQTILVSGNGSTVAGNNFSASSAAGFDLQIHPGWTSGNPGFMKTYWLLPFNRALTPFSGPATITFTYDPHLEYVYSDTPYIPVHDSVNHTLTWTISNIPSPSWDWQDVRPITHFRVPLSVSVGQQLTSTFSISPVTGDCDTSNNSETYNEVVTGSHDPNEKDVSPANSIAAEDSVLTYSIHFQNTGNDSTWFVIIRDTLSSFLDATSVQNIASSHPYSDFSISGEGILKWTFNPLRLVDSVTNPSGSKGFVMFTVKKRSDAPVGAIIQNNASIYFDYNVPVVTNTVIDTVMTPISANVSAVGTTCGSPNGSANVTIAGGVPPLVYHWSNNASTTSVSNLGSGTVNVTITDAYGYSVVANANVASSNAVPSPTINADKSAMCASDTANICAPAGFTTYLWNGGATTECVSTSLAGNYYVTVTDNANCSAESNHLSVTIYPQPSVSFSVQGDTLTAYNASSYQWYFEGNVINGATSNIYVATQSGNYSVQVVDSNGCSATSNMAHITTGIATLTQGYINVFPNPVRSDNWNLDVDDSWIGALVTIFDVSGKKLDQFVVTKNRTELTSGAESGVYLAQVVSKQRCYSVRLVRMGN